MSWKVRLKIVIGVAVLSIMTTFIQPVQAAEVLQARIKDGVVIRVHFDRDKRGEQYLYAQEALKAAIQAYRNIVFGQGFNRSGYTFASPSGLFAYDADKVIDIYIAPVEAPYSLMTPGGGLEYQANIYLPRDFQAYRLKYNITQPKLELEASLAHELLHIITFSYNRNMQVSLQGKASLTSHRWDWYTEGLARYFEYLAGYKEEFLSSGFRRQCGDAIMVYKGGVNYFLQYPDRPLDERKYDFALFWQYIHNKFGMAKIEQISCQFRQVDPLACSNRQAMEIVAKALGVTLSELWQDFALYVYKSSRLLAKQENGLMPVAMLPCSRTGAYSIFSFGVDYYEVDPSKVHQAIQIASRKDLFCLAAVASADNLQVLSVCALNQEGMAIALSDLPQDGKLILVLFNPSDTFASYKIIF